MTSEVLKNATVSLRRQVLKNGQDNESHERMDSLTGE